MKYEPAVVILALTLVFILIGMIYDMVIKDYLFNLSDISFKDALRRRMDHELLSGAATIMSGWEPEPWNKMFEPLCDDCKKKEASICSAHTASLYEGNHVC